ncbi:dephospho-CoA kinase [Thermosulfurimonas sp. F29]|uniref:dephospho-CoA kinase n=1 Tax=Thermosulfurimonas sp. F29 TaxID=2867247 RepID=UPI001C8291B9|nr:dephospho-CoA kinase [Thermosulfurimonas sp. F29]MBX6422877.1 dephospho-CoA kinase [Thermosulfurimonas sp. F29]
MRKVAVTGGPATGKTTLLAILKDLGHPVFSADEAVRRLIAPGGEAHRRVKALCPWAVRADGTLDRRQILARIVCDEVLRRKLEALLHPLVRKELLAFFESHSGADLVFAEIPLLFEAGWEGLFDEVWVVACGEALQRKRLLKRLEDPALVEGLLRSQLALSEKIKRAHRVFSSEKPPEELRRELQEVLSRMRRPASESP